MLKDYKIAWFTEGGWTGKVGLDNPNMRNDVSTMYTLGAEHFPIFQIPQVLQHFGENHFDFGIVTLPKTKTEELMKFDMMGDLNKLCKKTISMQEGPHWLFQDYTMEQQIWWFNALTEFDLLFAHNKKDVNYYRGVTDKPVHKMPTLMLTEKLGITSRTETLVDNYGDLPSPKAYDKDKVIIGGNMVRWYGGFDSYQVALEISDDITAITTGRMKQEENQILKHIPWVMWREWIDLLSNFRIGIQLGTAAAGQFQLNCSFHGIPCIGYSNLNTQRILHPLTTVELGDIDKAKDIAKQLKTDKFYNLCVETTQKRFEMYYSEKVFVDNWKRIWND